MFLKIDYALDKLLDKSISKFDVFDYRPGVFQYLDNVNTNDNQQNGDNYYTYGGDKKEYVRLQDVSKLHM